MPREGLAEIPQPKRSRPFLLPVECRSTRKANWNVRPPAFGTAIMNVPAVLASVSDPESALEFSVARDRFPRKQG